MLTDHAQPTAARTPIPGADPRADEDDWAEPEGPVERLSWARLGILLLVVAGVAAGGVAGVAHLRANAGSTAKSWAVPYVDVTLTPTFQFQDPQANPGVHLGLTLGAYAIAGRDKLTIVASGPLASFGRPYVF